MVQPELYGHRGAAGEAPENTANALAHLLRTGARRIEIDLRLSRDREVVVVHDSSIRRLSGRPGRISSLTAETLGRCAPPVPTLRDLISAGPEIEHWQLEIKPIAAAHRGLLIRKLVRTLKPLTDHPVRFTATSSSAAVLAALKAHCPALPRGVVVEHPGAFAYLPRFASRLAVVNLHLLSRWRVQHLQRSGIEVSVWTIKRWSEYVRARRLGVDSVIADHPQALMRALAG